MVEQMPDHQEEPKTPVVDLLTDKPEPAIEQAMPEKRKVWPIRLVALLLAFSVFILAFGGLLRLLGLPPFGLLLESGRLTRNATVRSWTLSVVAITADERRGTGFVIAPGQQVITNEHVIADADSVTVSFGAGRTVVSREWSAVKAVDLVCIRLPVSEENGLTLADDTVPKPGDSLTLIGNPLGFFRIVSMVEFIGLAQTGDWQDPLFAVRGPVYRGNSGSPVINGEGQVVGILFATVESTDSDGETIGLVIPAAVIRRTLDDLTAD